MMQQRLKKHRKKLDSFLKEKPFQIYKENIELRQTRDDRLTYYV